MRKTAIYRSLSRVHTKDACSLHASVGEPSITYFCTKITIKTASCLDLYGRYRNICWIKVRRFAGFWLAWRCDISDEKDVFDFLLSFLILLTFYFSYNAFSSLLALLSPPKEGGCVFTCVCLSVCLSVRWISQKVVNGVDEIFGGAENLSRNNRLVFGGDPIPDSDPEFLDPEIF